MQIINCLSLILLLISCRCEDEHMVGEDELIAVTALIRHGAKIPLSFYPTDPYQEYPWPYVLGDLANKGVREMFEVGEWLRERYTSFLSKKYTSNEIYVISAELDRTLMSAEATMAGLYPPFGSEVWNSKISWQPVPIHSSPLYQDILTDMLTPCPSKEKGEDFFISNSSIYPRIQEKYTDLFANISTQAGKPIGFLQLYPFFDTLFCEKKLGLPLPKWAEQVYPKLKPLIKLYTKMESMESLERKVQAGPLVTEIVNQFQRALNGQDFGTTETIYRKFMAYYSTEWLLYDFAYGVGLKSVGIPDYGALFLIELRQKHGNFYVNIFYKKRLETGAMPWNIEGQKFNLEFETFKKLVHPLIMNTTKWVDVCTRLQGRMPTVVTRVPMS